jgi:hypothetical protein
MVRDLTVAVPRDRSTVMAEVGERSAARELATDTRMVVGVADYDRGIAAIQIYGG